MTDPHFGRFTFGNVFDGTLEELCLSQKLAYINAPIQQGVSKCKQTCQYFAYCGGGAPSNKLCENKTFDSTETMSCKLGKQVLIDVVLDYLECKCCLPSVVGLSLVERVWRLQEQVKSRHDIIISKKNHISSAEEVMQELSAVLNDDDWDDRDNWKKH